MTTTIRADILTRVQRVITDVLQVEDIPLTEATSISKDLKADSVDIVSLLMDLEDEFGGEIPEQEASKLDTIGQIVDYIQSRADAN